MAKGIRPSVIAAVIGLVTFAPAQAGAADGAQSPKISNVLSGARPLAADHGSFVEAALRRPATGACEMLSPDPGFVEEMLLDVASIGAPGGRKYERRVALVVGNGAYEAISPLTNPPNDAASMAKMFRALGFTVYRAIDATERSLDECFLKFKGDLEKSDAEGAKADIALFFYAGHGLQLTSAADNEKRNYMMSVDARVDAETGKAKGFRQVDKVLTEMRAHSKQAVFLYDACRNAPYKEGAVKEADGQPVRAFDASGAAPISAEEGERASEAGLFIAYATSPGKTADDAWGLQGSTHSPFTEALLKNLATPGAILEEALAGAYYDTGQLTRAADGKSRQTPWTSSSLQAPLRLNGVARRSDVQVKSVEFAARSAAARERGLNGAAIALALKGVPTSWAIGERALAFAPARAELFRAHDARNLTIVGHDGIVTDASFSADGARIVTASSDKTVKVWNARSGSLIRTLEGHGRWVESAAFSDDGLLLVTTSRDGTAKLWDARTGALRHTLSGHKDRVADAAFSPDSARVVTASGDRTAKIWNTKTGALIQTLQREGDEYGVVRAEFSPDGGRVLTTSGEPRVWNANTGALITTIDTISAVARFSPDGTTIIAYAMDTEGSLGIWDASTGRPIRKVGSKLLPLLHAEFSPDGTRIATVTDFERTIRIWDLETGDEIRVLEGHTDEVGAVSFSADGSRIVSASEDSTARIWDETGVEPVTLLESTKYWTAEDAVWTASFSADGTKIATASSDKKAAIWDAKTRKVLFTLVGHKEGVATAAFNTDSTRVMTASKDGTVRIWRAKNGALLKTIQNVGKDLESAAWSPDGRAIATASRGGIAKIWNATSGAEITTLQGHGGAVYSAVFSPDGERVLTASADKTARIWDARTGTLLIILAGHADQVGRAAFSPDGELIATASNDSSARVWNARTGALLVTLVGHANGVKSVKFSPDGLRIATASFDKTARIWDAQTGALLKTLSGRYDRHSEYVNDAAFDPDGGRVVTASSDWTARLWNAGLYGPELLEAAYELLTDEQRGEVERERIRYWELDPALLQ